ncbi:phosphopantetheine-binding protein [Streptomyces sp. NBC_01537]|uniref:Pls/PosA family non-ribosomal peptide synthetase n=1 Tax=Streptomyces sp. NBC_01537 TaxID=2903896 RepID=UPI0038638FE6
MADKFVEPLTPTREESSAEQHVDAEPATGTERVLAEILAGVVRTERVSVDSHFFEDLGADSLLMAQFCARVRKRAGLPSVSMKDVYRYPTLRSLATALADAVPRTAEAPTPSPAAPSNDAVVPVSTPQYILCGALQLLVFLGYTCVFAVVATRGIDWITEGSGWLDVYLRSALFGGAAFLGLCTVPILAKWMLVGRWKPRQIRVWSMGYLRFWCAKTLIRANPLALFVGSPLYVLYLRALGAKVGRGVTIFSRHIPVCTDLLTIGEGTVIRKDSFFSCYRAHAGRIQTGPVTLGRDVFVGEATVIDIGASLGDGAQLGHSSALHAGQSVPGGECWHGSPAQPASVDYRVVEPARCGTARRGVHCGLQLLATLFLYAPLAIGGGAAILAAVAPQIAGLLEAESLALTGWTFYADALVTSFVLSFGSVLASLALVVTVPRLLHLTLKPDRVYRLYGFHYAAHRAITLITNRRLLRTLFGDSSGIVHYLRGIGYDLSRFEQTGSNFGTEVKHENPYLISVGTGTMVADGLSIINADFSNTSFRLSRVSIGPRNFLGNRIAYPSQGRTGENCLLATKVMVPIDGEIREGVGLLGSPSFEIPRSVERDSRFDHLKSGDELRRRLARKNKHNTATAGWYLLMRWGYLFGLTLIASGAADLHHSLGAPVVALASFLGLLFSITYLVLVERVVTGFKALSPLYCSIYDPAFWRHERYWKVTATTAYIQVLNGTPFKSVVWRMLGVRIGSRVFDDGFSIPERTLVTIGDGCMLNAGAVAQCHSQEDGTFKSDHSTIGANCTIGVNALVHYGVTMGEGAELAPDSFLMKGEEVPRYARWGGNPAREIPEDMPAPQVSRVAGGTGN